MMCEDLHHTHNITSEFLNMHKSFTLTNFRTKPMLKVHQNSRFVTEHLSGWVRKSFYRDSGLLSIESLAALSEAEVELQHGGWWEWRLNDALWFPQTSHWLTCAANSPVPLPWGVLNQRFCDRTSEWQQRPQSAPNNNPTPQRSAPPLCVKGPRWRSFLCLCKHWVKYLHKQWIRRWL